MHLLIQFYRQNKIDDFISFTNTRRTAQQTLFFFIFEKYNLEKKNVFPNCLWFCIIFLWKQMKNNFLELAMLLAIKFSTK